VTRQNTTARVRILAVAAKQGWRVHKQPAREGCLGEYVLRRVRREGRRQRTEYVRFTCDVLGRVIDVAWAPGLDGVDGRSPRVNKFGWTIRKLRES
jgi:hypothetical protein